MKKVFEKEFEEKIFEKELEKEMKWVGIAIIVFVGFFALFLFFAILLTSYAIIADIKILEFINK
tara:strand:+ start:165 stop:356 length:192 start_codon:yes stop_codon:yes gene_type:complete